MALCVLCGLAVLTLSAGCNGTPRESRAYQALSNDLRARADSTEVYQHWINLDDHYRRVEYPASYNAYLTWKDYNGLRDKQRALYVWNGREIGRGDEGLLAVLREWESLPPYSVVLVFPHYPLSTADPDFKTMPFANSWGDRKANPWSERLKSILVGRHSLIILSARDLDGNLVGN